MLKHFFPQIILLILELLVTNIYKVLLLSFLQLY